MDREHPPIGRIRGRKSRGEILILATAIAVLLAGVVQAIAGAASVGVTVDEPTQLMRTEGWIREGWYVPPIWIDEGDPLPSPQASPYVYGPAYSAVAHAANLVAGNESAGELSSSEAAWEVRHLVVAFVGLLAAAAVGLAVWLLTESSIRFAIWGAAALLSVPIWLGMSFFNPKDVPAAAGYTLFTIGLVVAMDRGRQLHSSRTRAVAIAGLLAVGFYLGAGTRLALWAALLAGTVVFGLLTWGARRLGGAPPSRLETRAVLIGLLLGVASVGASYPAVLSNPFDLLTHSITDSSDFPWTGITLTAGHLLSQDPPWWYLPAWAFASTPVLLLLFSTAGGAGPFVAGVRQRAAPGRLQTWFGRDDLAIVLIIQQALMLSVGSMMIGANMYSGLRQHLYVVPALAILAGVGAHRLWRRASRSGKSSRWHRWIAAILICAALAVPMVEQALLFPYNYVYVNPIAGLGGVNDRWETDFWWASSREALSELPASATPYCLSVRPGADHRPAATECAFAPVLAPYLDERQGAPATSDGPGSFFALSSKRALTAIPAECRDARDVTRWLRGEAVVMSYVMTCDASLKR